METSGTADGKAPLCLAEFVTLKDRGGLTEACVDGSLALIVCCNELDRRTINTTTH